MRPWLKSPILALVFTLGLSACSVNHGDHADEEAPPSARSEILQRKIVPATWSPEALTLNCGLNSCPKQVGALIFALPIDDTHVQLEQCTAFLIASDKIMSSGHCDFTGKGAGYFILQSELQLPAVHVGVALFKRYTPASIGLSGRPDIAVFQLREPLAQIAPLPLARGLPKIYSSLVTYAVNFQKDAEQITLKLSTFECKIHRHEQLFPYDLGESPDVITAFQCHAELGNSGAPMFAPDSWVVEAINQGAGPQAAELTNSSSPPLDFVRLTNLRCVDYPAPVGRPCVMPNPTESQRRFDVQLTAALTSRTLNLDHALPTRFRTYANPLAAKGSNGSPEFELLYFPVCREPGLELKEIFIYVEHVRSEWDEWGAPRLVSLKLLPASVTIQGHIADSYGLKVIWPAPPEAFRDPQLDPRNQLGGAFSVALPICPR